MKTAQKLNFIDCVFLGLGSILGAGVFGAFGPAASFGGNALIAGLLLAALVSCLNAHSMARLAVIHPQSGGAYVYGKKELSDFAGYLAGFCFVGGKIASCSAMALTFAYYCAPHNWETPTAIAALLAMSTINFFGIRKTAAANKILLVSILVCLLLSLYFIFSVHPLAPSPSTEFSPSGAFQASAFLFFAFAGYARLATLGGEIQEPEQNIPRAIFLSLALAFCLYLVVALLLLGSLGSEALSASKSPLIDAIPSPAGKIWPKAGASLASLGALLSLLAGISRTISAMAHGGHFPKFLGRLHGTFQSHHWADLMVLLGSIGMVFLKNISLSIGLSTFAVLLYYAIANLAAAKLGGKKSIISWLGFFACTSIAASAPTKSIFMGVSLMLVGTMYYFLSPKRT